jgi:hypothetical protein
MTGLLGSVIGLLDAGHGQPNLACSLVHGLGQMPHVMDEITILQFLEMENCTENCTEN